MNSNELPNHIKLNVAALKQYAILLQKQLYDYKQEFGEIKPSIEEEDNWIICPDGKLRKYSELINHLKEQIKNGHINFNNNPMVEQSSVDDENDNHLQWELRGQYKV